MSDWECEKQYYYLGYLPIYVRIVPVNPPPASVSSRPVYAWWFW